MVSNCWKRELSCVKKEDGAPAGIRTRVSRLARYDRHGRARDSLECYIGLPRESGKLAGLHYRGTGVDGPTRTVDDEVTN